MAADSSFQTRLIRFASSGGMRSLGWQLLAVTAVLIVAALILMSLTLSDLTASRTDSETTEDTMLQITTVESRILEFDGMLNGYALSGEKWFARRMAGDRSDIAGAMAKLKHSLRNDPAQTRKYEKLVSLMRRRDALNAYLLQPAHRDEIGRSAKARSVRRLTDRIRGQLWNILTTERTKRFDNHTKMIAEARQSFWIAVGIVLLTFLFAAFSMVLAVAEKSAADSRAGADRYAGPTQQAHPPI